MPEGRGKVDGARHEFDQGADDREAEARSFVARAEFAVLWAFSSQCLDTRKMFRANDKGDTHHLRKTLENQVPPILRYPDPRILHRNLQFKPLSLHPFTFLLPLNLSARKNDFNVSPLGKLDGIGNQIGHAGPDLGSIPVQFHPWIQGGIAQEFDALCPCSQFKEAEGGVDDVEEGVEGVFGEGEHARLGFGKEEDVVDGSEEFCGLLPERSVLLCCAPF